LKLVTSDQMRDIEQRAADAGLPSSVLMENAGLAVAREMKRLLGGVLGRRIVVLVGPGNNGGDGLVAARHLQDWGAEVHLCMPKERGDSDANYRLVRLRGIKVMDVEADGLAVLEVALRRGDAVIDAFFGTGKARPLGGPFKEVLLKVQEAKERVPKLQVIAVDVPSGMDADSGATDEGCPFADATVTLGYPKLGLFAFPGAARTGRLIVADIGIPPELAEEISVELITEEKARRLIPERPLDAHKGTFGRVLVVGGSANYIGAACLACEGAIRVGAGLVTLAAPRSLHPIMAGKLTEVTHELLPEAETGSVSGEAAEVVAQLSLKSEVLLLGCGLGQSQAASGFLKYLLSSLKDPPPLVIDADGLNLLSRGAEWWRKLPDDAVLTPHPREMSRLSGLSMEEIQVDRINVAKKAAAKWRKVVVLKGAHTVVADPRGTAYVSPWANPGLASAGTGDVLAGIIAGLVAQGVRPVEAAVLGVYLHGKAAEVVRQRVGDMGMAARDLVADLPIVIKGLRYLHG
jgi:ADP-dependent NAD(P)H-hydrate dehydratase / NAD(P)H-hydrate epimerase